MDITPSDITPPSQPPQSSKEKRKAAGANSNKKPKQPAVQKPAPAKPADEPIVIAKTPPPEAIEEQLMEDMDGMIATAAYYLAERRNFAPGHELEDWLEAEQQLRK